MLKTDNKRLFKFLIITFAITYISWSSLAVLIKLGFLKFTDTVSVVMHLIGGFGPTIATLFVFKEKLTLKSLRKFIFNYDKKNIKYLIILSIIEILVIGLSSMEFNSQIPIYFVPIIFIQAVFIYGGNEELGWRGIMQPIMEEKFTFPIATIITGIVWGFWHIPLWFVDGASQQNINFFMFVILGVILSFCLAAIYKKTKSVFSCNIFHGLSNTLLSLFIIKVNVILVIGLCILTSISIYIWNIDDKLKLTEEV